MRVVFDLIVAHGAPIKAYDLLSLLERELGRHVSPPTVYRALAALVANGEIARIERLSAYAVARTRGAPRVFLLCSDCGTTIQSDRPALSDDIASLAMAAGFAVGRSVIEVEGLCRSCQRPPAESAR